MSRIINIMELGRKTIVLLLLAMSFSFNISSQLSPNPCLSCHFDGRYMHLHIDENPLNPLPTSVKIGSTYNITLNIQNICDKSQNNVMSNVTVTLRSRAGHSRVDIPTRVIPVLTPSTKALTWKLSGESSGLEVLEFIAIATNAHNNLTLFDTLIHDLEVIPSSTTFMIQLYSLRI
jgi:hypothetical protein